MVVNGGCILSLVIPYSNHVDLTNYLRMAGKAVLICRPNSHPFVDRYLNLEQPVKIGRSVARARASQTNGIFDCKVLSRNHAVIWYCNGKFYLQDTKSSNGTFVNNQRLSKSGEESLPREVSSGDIVQFGVDVLENTRKVTHGCIVANLKLYLPDGKESKASPFSSVLGGIGDVSIEDLYQLNQHIQEALQREQMLHTKLDNLQQLVQTLRQAADLGWSALIAEDRLLSRVEILENQIQTYAKNVGEDKLREELHKLQEDKSVYQGLAKECLQKVLQEKLEAVYKCQNMESALTNAEQECTNLKEAVVRNQVELQELALKHNSEYLKTVELQNKLQDSEEALAKLEGENDELTAEVTKLLANEAVMRKKLEQLENSAPHQLIDIEPQLPFKKSPDIHDLSSLKEPNGSTADVFCKNEEDEELKDENQISNSMDTLINRLKTALEEQNRAKEAVELILAQTPLLQSEKMSKLLHVNSLEAELEIHEDKMCIYKKESKKLEQTLNSLEQKLKEENMNKIDTPLIGTAKMNGGDQLSNGSPSPCSDSLTAQIEDLKEALKESRSKMDAMERTIDLLQVDLRNAEKNFSEVTKNWLIQEDKLKAAQSVKDEAESTVNTLLAQLKTLENSLLQVKLQEKFESESEHINKHKEEVSSLKKQLQEAQQIAKQNKNEAEIVKEKLRVTSQELEAVRSRGEANGSDSQQDNKATEELAAARLEAASHLARVIDLESQIKKLKAENSLREQELTEANQSGTKTDCQEGLGDAETVLQKMRLRIGELEEELVIVKEKYMACNEKNTQVNQELVSLRQDYDAVVHQPYFVHNQHYLLGIASLVIAILLSLGLYPSS